MPNTRRKVRIFSALEVARLCGVVNQTAINWIKSGHLKAFTTPGGQYRIYAKDLAAFLDKRGMNTSREALHIMMENANWNLFLLAMEQSANNTLKSEIENLLGGYSIIQAFDWFEVGRKITEKKPGFILLDSELPGVDPSKFIKTVKEDPSFGVPFVFLLTGSGTELRSQADMVLTKPLDLNKLGTTLKEYEKQIPEAKTG